MQQLRALLDTIERFDAQITAFAQTLPDSALFQALPGAGPISAPRLLAAFGEQRERSPSTADVQQYSGVALVT